GYLAILFIAMQDADEFILGVDLDRRRPLARDVDGNDVGVQGAAQVALHLRNLVWSHMTELSCNLPTWHGCRRDDSDVLNQVRLCIRQLWDWRGRFARPGWSTSGVGIDRSLS